MLDRIQINDFILNFYTLSIMICRYTLSFCNATTNLWRVWFLWLNMEKR